MEWATLIQLVLKVVACITDYLSRQQLLDAGKAQIISEGLRTTIDNLQKASDVKKELADNPTGDYASGVRDKYTRSDE